MKERTKRERERERERERDDLIIGQACTLTYFRESIVKGAEKPESRQKRRKGEWRRGKRTRKGVKEEAQE